MCIRDRARTARIRAGIGGTPSSAASAIVCASSPAHDSSGKCPDRSSTTLVACRAIRRWRSGEKTRSSVATTYVEACSRHPIAAGGSPNTDSRWVPSAATIDPDASAGTSSNSSSRAPAGSSHDRPSPRTRMASASGVWTGSDAIRERVDSPSAGMTAQT